MNPDDKIISSSRKRKGLVNDNETTPSKKMHKHEDSGESQQKVTFTKDTMKDCDRFLTGALNGGNIFIIVLQGKAYIIDAGFLKVGTSKSKLVASGCYPVPINSDSSDDHKPKRKWSTSSNSDSASASVSDSSDVMPRILRKRKVDDDKLQPDTSPDYWNIFTSKEFASGDSSSDDVLDSKFLLNDFVNLSLDKVCDFTKGVKTIRTILISGPDSDHFNLIWEVVCRFPELTEIESLIFSGDPAKYVRENPEKSPFVDLISKLKAKNPMKIYSTILNMNLADYFTTHQETWEHLNELNCTKGIKSKGGLLLPYIESLKEFCIERDRKREEYKKVISGQFDNEIEKMKGTKRIPNFFKTSIHVVAPHFFSDSSYLEELKGRKEEIVNRKLNKVKNLLPLFMVKFLYIDKNTYINLLSVNYPAVTRKRDGQKYYSFTNTDKNAESTIAQVRVGEIKILLPADSLFSQRMCINEKLLKSTVGFLSHNSKLSEIEDDERIPYKLSNSRHEFQRYEATICPSSVSLGLPTIHSLVHIAQALKDQPKVEEHFVFAFVSEKSPFVVELGKEIVQKLTDFGFSPVVSSNLTDMLNRTCIYAFTTTFNIYTTHQMIHGRITADSIALSQEVPKYVLKML